MSDSRDIHTSEHLEVKCGVCLCVCARMCVVRYNNASVTIANTSTIAWF